MPNSYAHQYGNVDNQNDGRCGDVVHAQWVLKETPPGSHMGGKEPWPDGVEYLDIKGANEGK